MQSKNKERIQVSKEKVRKECTQSLEEDDDVNGGRGRKV